jgi:hypothetical protein
MKTIINANIRYLERHGETGEVQKASMRTAGLWAETATMGVGI